MLLVFVVVVDYCVDDDILVVLLVEVVVVVDGTNYIPVLVNDDIAYINGSSINESINLPYKLDNLAYKILIIFCIYVILEYLLYNWANSVDAKI